MLEAEFGRHTRCLLPEIMASGMSCGGMFPWCGTWCESSSSEVERLLRKAQHGVRVRGTRYAGIWCLSKLL